MKKIISVTLFVMLSLVAILCAGCNGEPVKKFEIVEKDPLPFIEPYNEFDIKTAFEVEEGVEYGFEGYYSNSKGVEVDIEFSGSTFTINSGSAEVAVITVTGVKGKETVKKEISLTIQGNPDVIDNGFYETEKDGVITKSLNYDPRYVKKGSSSIKVNFAGYYEANQWGAQFAYLLGRLCTVEDGIYDTDYFSIYKQADQDKAWEDAVMTFWVYYSNAPKDHEDTKLDIGYRVLWHAGEPLPENEKDFDFGQSPVTQCKPGEWTQIAIRFKDFNKVTPLFLDYGRYKFGWTSDRELHEICDIMSFKCRVEADDLIPGEGSDDQVKYTYSFYFDDVDIMTFSDFIEKYPDFDLNQSKKIFPQDVNKNINISDEIKNFSSSGKAFVFDYKAIDDDTNTGDVIRFSLWGRNWGTPRRTELITVNVVTNDVKFNEASVGSVEELEDGWYRVFIPANELPVNTAEGATGAETIGMIYFNTVEHAFEINNIGFVEIDS